MRRGGAVGSSARAALAVAVSLLLPGVVAVPAVAGPEHVVVVSIDGLRPEFYRGPADAGFEVPNLRALAAAGVQAERMLGVFPTLTYPAHATLVTGTLPATHGIVSNFKTGLEWYTDAADIAVPTLWSAARAKGLTTAVVTWPSTYGARVDFLVPEDLGPDGERTARERIRAGSSPGLFDALEAAAGRAELLPFDDPAAAVPLDAMTAVFAARVMREHRPHLLFVHFLDADHQQHYAGPGSAAVRRAVETIDGHLGTLRAAVADAGLADGTLFVIVGDHGFDRVHTAINLAAVLTDPALAPGEDGVAPVEVRSGGGVASVHLAPGSDPALAAVVERDLRRAVEGRFAGLLRWIDGSELSRLGAYPGAVGAVAASPGYLVAHLPGVPEMPLLPTGVYEGMHGYDPGLPSMATGLILSGPGVRKGLVLPMARMVDVAPTVATLLGLEMPEATGLPIVGALDGSPGG